MRLPFGDTFMSGRECECKQENVTVLTPGQYCFILAQYCHNRLISGTRLEQNVTESLTCADSGFVHPYILNQIHYWFRI